MKLDYIAFPYKVNQAWGISNPLYEKYGFARHNGEDIALGNDRTIYAPFDCVVVDVFNQAGGGNVVSVMSLESFDFNEWTEIVKTNGNLTPILFKAGRCRVLLDFLHLDHWLVSKGDILKVGDKLAIADNTGESTGPHTHIQARRVTGNEDNWQEYDKNDAHNTFNHARFYSGQYAAFTGISRVLISMQKLLLILLGRINK